MQVKGGRLCVCPALLSRQLSRALCFASLNSRTRASACYPREKEQGPLERFMLRDKTLFKSLHDGPCQPLLSPLPRDDTSSPWKPITRVHPVYYLGERDI